RLRDAPPQLAFAFRHRTSPGRGSNASISYNKASPGNVGEAAFAALRSVADGVAYAFLGEADLCGARQLAVAGGAAIRARNDLLDFRLRQGWCRLRRRPLVSSEPQAHADGDCCQEFVPSGLHGRTITFVLSQ